MPTNRALIGLLAIILYSILIHDLYTGLVDAVGEFALVQMMKRVNLKREELISNRHKTPLDKWRAENERMTREAFKVINNYLESTVEQDDLDSNLIEVRRLIDNMRDGGTGLSFRTSKKRTSFIKWPINKPDNIGERSIMRVALLSLTDLQGTWSLGVDCTSYTTHKLAKTNRYALDTIGRRERGDEDILPRIDHLIFTAVLQRAETCLPKYKEQLMLVSGSSTESDFDVMRTYWDKIFEHRMRQVNFGEGKPIDEIFSEHPKAALELVKTMMNALEVEELSIGDEIFNNQASSSWDVPKDGSDIRIFNFNKYVLRPCDNYIAVVGDIIQSLDFDLRLARFMPEPLVQSVDHNSVLNKHRAYCSMCEKAIIESDRIKRLLKREN